MLNKKNSFYDFISCAEYLTSNSYGDINNITIDGRSAGGLLVSASFKTIISIVPFVDIMNTLQDPTIPLTIPEYLEWGNPHNKHQYDYLLSYSPYDNIIHTKYPNMFFIGGLYDPRVAYWEPTKFIAKIREYNENTENIMLLRINMNAGHFSASDRYKYLEETALIYSFVLTRPNKSN